MHKVGPASSVPRTIQMSSYCEPSEKNIWSNMDLEEQ